MSKDTQELLVEKDSKLVRKKYRFPSIVMSKSEGARIIAVDGSEYIDFTSGGQTCNLGHNHPEIIKAVRNQIELTGFCTHGWMRNETRTRLAEKLVKLVGGKIKNPKVGFCISGSDATELVMHLAKTLTRRQVTLCHFGSYHGSISAGALSLNTSAHTRSVPEIPGVLYQPFPYCFRCPFGQDYDHCDLACLSFFEYQLETNVIPPDNIAAFFIELVQVHGGVLPVPKKYLSGLRRICKREGIQLAVDEVTTGFGRTGQMLAIDHYDTDVDMIYFAKSIANGLSLGAVLGNENLMSNFTGGGTFSGSPISCAASLANIEILQRNDTLKRALQVGEYLFERLNEIKASYSAIGDVRGRGLLVGVELVSQHNLPAPKRTREVLDHLLRAGLLVFPAGSFQNVLRLCPPLIINESIVNRFIGSLEDALRKSKTTNK